MKEPEHFQLVFWGTMTLIASILGGFAAINVIAFGNVTNGSVTAFLLDAYKDDPSITLWVMAANTAVSLSVLLTYPLQLFPALELIGTSRLARWIGCLEGTDEEDEDKDLSGFEPGLPSLPEHNEMDMDSYPAEHHYGQELEQEENDEAINDDAVSVKSVSTLRSVTDAVFPKMIMHGDTPQLRLFLVMGTYIVAVAVPNVQALISLVGALAGSSTALLIPPVLELAWIKTLEEHHRAKHSPVINKSPRVQMRKENEEEQEQDQSGAPAHSAPFKSRKQAKKSYSWFGGKHRADKIKCYFLFIFGIMFTCIGTYASLRDIIRIYAGKPEKTGV
mgnify:CR=1 FL=1